VRRRTVSVLVGCLLMAGVAAGCTTARSNLGTADSSCYLSLPTAAKAVGQHGHLVGVHGFTLGKLHHDEPKLFGDLSTKLSASQHVCVVAYTGTFTRASVSHPLGRSSGKLAVVVDTFPSNHLLGTVIFHHLPLHFSHTHIG
jgi:hypothetical protein